MTIKLTPSPAFGDGNHPTTQGVMRMMHELTGHLQEQPPRAILDMGCGSGILSILAAQLWEDAQILAADIEEEAVTMTMKHTAMNGVSGMIRSIRSDGFSHPEINTSAPYDLIIANMLAAPLLTMAQQMEKHLSENGILLLSGILDWQEPTIREAYEAAGLRALEATQVKEWLSILLVKE